ncbi:hypothetical protein A5881_003621 [Enterococcus termitis]
MFDWANQKSNFDYLLYEIGNISDDLLQIKINNLTLKFSLLRSKIINTGYDFWFLDKESKPPIIKVNEQESLNLEIYHEALTRYFNEPYDSFLHLGFRIKFKGKTFFVWFFSHIIADGYSLEMLSKELTTIFSSEQELAKEIERVDNLNTINYPKTISKEPIKQNEHSKGKTIVKKKFSISRDKLRVKDSIIFGLVKQISEVFEKNIVFSTLTNFRFTSKQYFNHIRDLHDEFVYEFVLGKTNFEDYRSDLLNYQGGHLADENLISPNIQINYDFNPDFEIMSSKDNEGTLLESLFERLLEEIEKDFSSQKLIFIDIIESFENVYFEIETTIPEKDIEIIIKKFVREETL